MLQSKLFGSTLREPPKDEKSVNAVLLLRGAYIDKLMAGVYSFLPLGWRVHRKIEEIIRQEMNAIGGQEVLMPILQPKELWDETDSSPPDDAGWGRMRDIMYQFRDKSGRDVGIGPTHEELMVDVVRRRVHSYRDLPFAIYHFRSKFRHEPRAKSGLIRLREFIMKDLYSFHKTRADLEDYYEIAKSAYQKIYSRCGLESLVVEASGGAFTKNYSHEFQVVCEAGEDTIAHCRHCKLARNSEIFDIDKIRDCPNCGSKDLSMVKCVEVGNIFRFYDKYADDMHMMYRDESGKDQPVYFGSYGIGLARLMATVVEIYHDDNGIVWPEEIAPFRVHMLILSDKELVVREAKEIYQMLVKLGVEVLLDDRSNVSPGEKFQDADLLGMPYRVVVSEKTVKAAKVELKKRNEDVSELITKDQLKQIVYV